MARQPLLAPSFHIPPAMIAPLSRLRRAIAESRKLRFNYVRADGQASTRTVCPLGLFFWGDTWTLGARCELRGEFRAFRIDRVAELAVLDESFDKRGGQLLEEYIRMASRHQSPVHHPCSAQAAPDPEG